MKPKCPVCGKEMILFSFDVVDHRDYHSWEIRGYDFDCKCVNIWEETVDKFDYLEEE
ncbi:MAG: hypothetical protein RBT49_06280 [Bacteroidales bacterium]|jgi:hypothetical protein|nr:hypothetical protein [Bacteroidales bacterium]